jgi:8-oxo-dGTP diphosphatase
MKNETQPMQRVIACVIQKDATILLCRRPPHKRHGGLWEFPGGKCEAGESDADTVRRELHEELGIHDIARVGSPLFEHRDPGSCFLIAFVPVAIFGVPEAMEHSEIRWISVDDIPSLELAPSDAAFARFMHQSCWHTESTRASPPAT